MAGKEKGRNLESLDLLREVYLENLGDARARASSLGASLRVDASSVRSALRAASEKRLVRTEKGIVSLTPAGRRRLKVVMMGGALSRGYDKDGHANPVPEPEWNAAQEPEGLRMLLASGVPVTLFPLEAASRGSGPAASSAAPLLRTVLFSNCQLTVCGPATPSRWTESPGLGMDRSKSSP